MKDRFGRNVDYMRISITDRCNLRCRYCMPDGCEWIPMEEILTLEEITEVCREAAQLGIRYIKITGGEPLVRRGCADLIGMLKKIPGIEQVTLTTNGLLLEQYADALCASGLDAVNISLDTLNAERYAAITGVNALGQALRGIEVIEHRVPTKINAVLQYGINEKDWQSLAELARSRSLDVRFIEMMPIGYGAGFRPVSNRWILKQLKEHYGAICPERIPHGNGPAVYYRIPGFIGCIGLISAIHGKFCAQCNRIRMTSTGQIKPCLCYAENISVREALREGDTETVKHLIQQAVEVKPGGHCFEDRSIVTEKRMMSKIGG